MKLNGVHFVNIRVEGGADSEHVAGRQAGMNQCIYLLHSGPLFPRQYPRNCQPDIKKY